MGLIYEKAYTKKMQYQNVQTCIISIWQ